MLLIFPIDDETNACIAWGRLRPDRSNPDGSPVTMTPYANGTIKFNYTMTVMSKNIGGNGKNAKWEQEFAGVSIYAKEYDQRGCKIADVTKLLRAGDPVLVFGKYRSHEWTDGNGQKRTGHDIIADVLLPSAWLYDIILALFAQVVAKQASPRLREVKQPAPKKGTPKIPQVAHVNVMNEEDWFE